MQRSRTLRAQSSTEELSPAALVLLNSHAAKIREILARRQETADRLKEAIRDADAVRERCRKFENFVSESWHTVDGAQYMPNWHIGAIGEHLEAMHRGEITRLLINIPPGMMKSTTVSVMLGPWEWGPMGKPHLRYLTTSYEATYARRDSRKHRNMVLSEWYQRLWPMKLTKLDEANFENEFKGGRMAVPWVRMTAGRGNRLVIDDPHSVRKAESPQERNTATMLFREQAQSRLNNQEQDSILLMMQRLHPEDMSGVIEELGLPYVKLILPMEYVRSLSVKTPWFTDPRTKEGELLFPRMLGPEKAETLKITTGEHAWQTQYQQRPRSRKGSSFFNLEHFLIEHKTPRTVDGTVVNDIEYKPVPWPKKVDLVFSISDTATKVGGKRDGTGTVHYGFCLYPKPLLLVLDWNLIQIQADTLPVWLPGEMQVGQELATECRARVGYKKMYIEDKDSGQALLQYAAKHPKLSRFVEAIPSELTALGKENRAVSVSGYINQGKVKVTDRAYEKVVTYHGRTANHFIKQATEFRVGLGTPLDEDELFDGLCYGAALTFGDQKGL